MYSAWNDIKNVHCCISFDQKPWMKPYIEYNTVQRAACKNEFEKNFLNL